MPISEKSFELALGFAQSLIDTSQLPVLLFDSQARVVCASHSFYSDFGISSDGVEGRLLAEIAGGGWDVLQLSLLLENALCNGPHMGDYETDLVRSGVAPRRLQVNVQTVMHGADLDTRALMAITDVTQVRQSERLNITLLLEKDGLLRERAILLDEMEHRIANSLQIIASILLLKARAVKSEETRLHLRDAHDRVMSLAAVQQHLHATVGTVDVKAYMTKLCESLAASMIGEGRQLTLKVLADDAVVSSHEAVSLGLVVTELVINALKHAFPQSQGGLITVSYRAGAGGWTLSVTDNGIGMPAVAPAAKAGLGTSIIEGLAKQLGATIKISNADPGVAVALAMTAAPPA
ncbi:MAG TPA: histidine kinase dimerization/phosphoacceptor domain -containing protein [Hyphomonadaceae bacterium]|nr:histidine kinase dimerization/phosphoacceptor domain -containing protein [Hyphomonadaceae bacterium]